MGDVDKGFAEADFIGEGTYAYENVLNPLPLELPGVIAEWEGPGRLTVWSATQSASGHRFIVLSKMGFPDIRAISTHRGGSFGSNLDPLEFFGKNYVKPGERYFWRDRNASVWAWGFTATPTWGKTNRKPTCA